MLEVYYEETAFCIDRESEKKKYLFWLLIGLFMFFASCWWFVSSLLSYDFEKGFMGEFIFQIAPLFLSFPASIICIRRRLKHLIDYDYIFNSGTIKIARIFNSNARKLLHQFETNEINKIGRYNSDTFHKIKDTPDVDTCICTPNTIPYENKAFYYLYIITGSKRRLVIIECTEELLINIIKYTGKKVLEENFK